jgi:prevent-host-death family protein
MLPIPDIVGISDLRLRQNEVLSRLHKGPVVLTQHSRAVAVLVSPEQWNEIIERLEEAEDALDILEARARNEPTTGFADYLASRDDRVLPAS